MAAGFKNRWDKHEPSLISALGKVGVWELRANLVYIASSRPARAAELDSELMD